MEDYIMTIMKRASIFMILSQALIHFRPNPSYEKYFKFLAGIMTVVILVIPVMELLRSGMMEQYQARMNEYTEYLEEISEQELAISMTPSQSYIRTMEEEMEKKLSREMDTAEYEVSRVEIMGVSGDGESAEEDCRVKISFVPSGTQIPVIEIEEIDLQDETGAETALEGSGRARKLRKEAADLLGMEEDRVEVEICE